jgi:hypothetical protein
MSLAKFSLWIVAGGLFAICQTANQTADAQVRIQYGTPSYYYGNQPVYRSNTIDSRRIYRQPSYQSSQQYYRSYPPTFPTSPQRYSSGYRGYGSRSTYGSPYGNTYQSYRPSYSDQRYYGNGINNQFYNGYNYQSPSQQRGAIIGGAIGDAIGGNRGGNVGAAIGSAIGRQ